VQVHDTEERRCSAAGSTGYRPIVGANCLEDMASPVAANSFHGPTSVLQVRNTDRWPPDREPPCSGCKPTGDFVCVPRCTSQVVGSDIIGPESTAMPAPWYAFLIF